MAFPADGSAWYNTPKGDMPKGDLDWETADIRIVPVMTSHSSDKDDNTVGGFATFDVFDGSNYTQGTAGKTLGSAAVAVDDTNDRAELDGADITFSNLIAGTRQITGFVITRFVTTATAVPIAFLDVNDFNPNSGDITIVWSSEGILHIT